MVEEERRPPPPAASFVVVAFEASGDPNDYGADARQQILDALWAATGIGGTTPLGSTLRVTAASVHVEAAFPTESAAVTAQASADLRAQLNTTSALQAALDTAGVSITVTAGATVAELSTTTPLPSASATPAPVSALSAFTLWYSLVYDYYYRSETVPFMQWIGGAPSYLTSLAALWIWVLLLLICACIPYLAFQKHLLPHCLGKWVGRIYFVPCLPCTIYGNKKTFKGRWWAFVDDGTPPVILGQAPLFNSQLRELETLGVGAIVNLCDEYKGLSGGYKKNGMSLLWLKTVDHLEPSVEAMRTACSFIEHHRKRGVGVYIHCKSGRGRSAAIAMAWLIQVKRMRPLEANQHLLRVRKVRDKLFLQKNVIQFYEDLEDEVARGHGPAEGTAGLGPSGRALSFATPWRRNSLQAAPPDGSGRQPFRAFRRSIETIGEGRIGLDTAPPNWEVGTQGGVWEVNVARNEPAIPAALPPWAQEQREQYRQMQPPVAPESAAAGGRTFSFARFGQAFPTLNVLPVRNEGEWSRGDPTHQFSSPQASLVSTQI